MLNAPDYTRTCGCGYQNRSSLALVSMPDVEYWTYGAVCTPGRIGFNFGAPGDRRAADGTLWLAVPNVPDQMARDKTLWWGHEAAADADYVPRPDVASEPPQPDVFYCHSSRVTGEGGWPWVAASGVEGIRSMKVPLHGIGTAEPFTVRLYFADPVFERAGGRSFDVSIDGRQVVSGLDVAAQAGGRWRTFVVEVPDVKYAGQKVGREPAIEIQLRARTGPPLLCGVEIIEAAGTRL